MPAWRSQTGAKRSMTVFCLRRSAVSSSRGQRPWRSTVGQAPRRIAAPERLGRVDFKPNHLLAQYWRVQAAINSGVIVGLTIDARASPMPRTSTHRRTIRLTICFPAKPFAVVRTSCGRCVHGGAGGGISGGVHVHLSALRRHRAAQPEFNGRAQPDVQGGGAESLQEGLENRQGLNGACEVCKAGKWKMARATGRVSADAKRRF